MNTRFVITTIGKLLLVLSGVLLIPLAIALYDVRPVSFVAAALSPELSGFMTTVPLALLVGFVLTRITSPPMSGNAIREGFAIVTFGWIVLAFFGALPLASYFLLVGDSFTLDAFARAFTDAYFEIMSGFTTTGSTILLDIEAVPKALLFWRSTTHWLGGMGIVTLALAILPAAGTTAYQMFRGEVPGPTAEKLGPKLRETAKVLWGVYALLTFIEVILLMFGGMPLFDSICHAFGTLATGGFSTQNASIGQYNSAYFEWVIIVFMFFAGVNFILWYQAIFKKDLWAFWKNSEFRFYTGVIVIATLFSTVILQINGLDSVNTVATSYRNTPLVGGDLIAAMAAEAEKITPFFDALRHSAFQVVAITTTTGFGTADFDMWPNVLRVMLVVLMFFGGSAGSTGGGIKMIRIQVMFKMVAREISRITHPRRVQAVKVGGQPIEEKQVSNITAFIIIFSLTFVTLTVLLSFFVGDFTTASTAVVAALCNIGPGLSGVGATQNFEWIPLGGKWILILAMLLGRLELFTVIIALSPSSWKK